MIIKELNIIGFGKHTDKKITLEPGINVIYGENESGKSTICSFIYAMLYGIEKKRGKVSPESIYAKYQPVSDVWKGSMIFSHEGKDYEIFRSFPDSKEPVVIELLSGAIVDNSILDSAFLKERLYGATLYMTQNKADESAVLLENIKEYTDNMSVGHSEQVDIKAGVKILKGQIKDLGVERDSIKTDISRLKVKKDNLSDAEKEYKQWAENLRQLKDKISNKNQEKENNVLKIKDYCDRFSDVLLKYERYTQEKKQAGLIFEMEAEKEKNRLSINKKAKRAYLFLMAGVFLLGLLLTLMLSIGTVEKIAIVVAIAFAEGIVNFFWDNKIIKRLARIFVNNEARMSMEEDERARQIIEELESLKAEIEEYGRGSVKEFVADDTGMERLNLSVEELNLNVEKYYALESERIGALHKEIDKTELKLNDIVEKMAGESYESIGIELERQMEKLVLTEEKLRAAKLTLEMIQKLSKEMLGDFRNQIAASFSKNVNRLTLGKYERTIIDEQMGIKVLINGDFVDISKLSCGVVKQIFLALRLTVAEWLDKKDMPFIMDEGFAFYDDQRHKRAIEGLDNLALSQVILFTCHDREERALKELGKEFNLVRV